MKKTPPVRRTRGETATADPYKPARRPAGTDRTLRASGPPRRDRAPLGDRPPRAKRAFDKPAYVKADRPARSFDRPLRSTDRPPRTTERPPRSFDRPPRDGDAPRFRPPRGDGDRPAYAPRGERSERGPGFTVNLDPDVARVFRGDASVNKALRLVIQMMQVVQGPPPREGGARYGGDRPPRASTGYQGSAEARGFERKPKFEEEDEE